ncbi:hypothetical protein DFH06DRAFT_1146158 [Mycena polygramma]|nr:hypothetical protein DFH06DRAFT_1146158 [Mycena polygramma]
MPVDPEPQLVGEAFLAFLRLVDPPHTFNVVGNDTTRYLINGAVWLHPDLLVPQLGSPVLRNFQDKLYEKLTDIYMHLFELLRMIWGEGVFSIPVPKLAVISCLDENECSTAILHVNSLLFGALIQSQDKCSEYAEAFKKMDSPQKAVLNSILKKRHPAVFYRIWEEVLNSRVEIPALEEEVDDVNAERRRLENALQTAENNNETGRDKINDLEDRISELKESLKEEGDVSSLLYSKLEKASEKQQQLMDDLEDRESKCQKAAEKAAHLKEEKEQLKADIRALNTKSQERHRSQDSDLEELVGRLTDSGAALQRANTALQVKYDDCSKALHDMTDRWELLRKSLAEAQPNIKNAVEARDAVAQLQQKLQTAQEEAETLTGRLEELQNQVAQGSHTDTPYAPSLAEETAVNNRTAIEELQTENERLRREVSRLHNTQSRQASVAEQRSTLSDRKMVYEDHSISQEDASHSRMSLPLNIGEASEPAEQSDHSSSRSSSDVNDRSITRSDGVLVEDPGEDSSEEPQDDKHQKQSSCSSPSFDVNDQGSMRESDAVVQDPQDEIVFRKEPNTKSSMLPSIADVLSSSTEIQQGILNYIQELESTLQAAQNSVEHLETIRKDENKASVRRIVKLVSEQETSVHRICQLESEKRDLQAELEAEKRLQANVSEEQQSQMEALETTLQEAKESKSQMEAEKRNLLTNILEQQSQMKALKTTLEALKTTLEAAKESKSELEAKQRNLQVSVTKQQSAINSLQTKLHVEQEARSKQEETLRVCENELKQLKRSAASNVEALTDRIEKLEDKVAQQKGHIKDLQNKMSALEEEIEECRDVHKLQINEIAMERDKISSKLREYQVAYAAAETEHKRSILHYEVSPYTEFLSS